MGTTVLIYYFPILFQTIKDLSDHQFTVAALAAIMVATLILSGGLAYATSFPLRHWPNKFDILGNSQTCMHVAVVGAHVMEYFFLLDVYRRSQ